MSINLLLLIWFHWLSDFVFQSDKMAKRKNKSNKWLTIHVLVYSIPFLYFGWKFALVNLALHWLVDYFTSRVTSELWVRGEVHYFFVVIGLDQAIHITTLILTFNYLVK